MRNDLTNLLPHERRHALSRDYFFSLGVVATIGVTVLTLVSMALLVPTYILLTERTRAKEAQLASIESVLSSTSETELAARLATLSKNTETLSALARTPSASVLMRSVLAVPRPGITLSGFVYTPAEGALAGTLAISGVAALRTALRSYQFALQNESFVQGAELPVSAYAKDSNIAFTVTLTLTLTP